MFLVILEQLYNKVAMYWSLFKHVPTFYILVSQLYVKYIKNYI
jgi:hypothetical protein